LSFRLFENCDLSICASVAPYDSIQFFLQMIARVSFNHLNWRFGKWKTILLSNNLSGSLTPPFCCWKNGICNIFFYSKDDIKKIVSLLYNREGFQCIFRHKCKQIGLFFLVRFSLDLWGIYGWRPT
jgi:hypothetical protein